MFFLINGMFLLQSCWSGRISFKCSPIENYKKSWGLNIQLKDLCFIGNSKSSHKHSGHLTDNEFHYIYIAEFISSIDDLTLQAEEVSEIRLVAINQLKNQLLNKKFTETFVPYSEAYFAMIFEAIEAVV